MADVDVGFTIPDAQAARVQAAVLDEYDYDNSVGGKDEGVGQLDFFNNILKDFTKQVVIGNEAKAAGDAARVAARDAADSEINFT